LVPLCPLPYTPLFRSRRARLRAGGGAAPRRQDLLQGDLALEELVDGQPDHRLSAAADLLEARVLAAALVGDVGRLRIGTCRRRRSEEHTSELQSLTNL